LNTNKGAVQEALTQLMSTFVSELNLQLGIMDPEGIYRMQFDYAKSLGIDGGRYLSAPSANAQFPDILVEEALNEILMGKMPKGRPAEGAQLHYQKLLEFLKSDELGVIGTEVDAAHLALLKGWIENVRNLVISEQQKAKMVAAAQQFQASRGQGGGQSGGGPTAPSQQTPTPLQPNELLDESLPSSGGGQGGEGGSA
jgi:hypothetical protein